MPEKVNLSEQQVLVNRFAFCLLKHFKDSKIQVQGFSIKIRVDQLCGQDFAFLIELSHSMNKELGINVRRSAKGLSIILGVASLTTMPAFLKNYQRGDEPIQSY